MHSCTPPKNKKKNKKTAACTCVQDHAHAPPTQKLPSSALLTPVYVPRQPINQGVHSASLQDWDANLSVHVLCTMHTLAVKPGCAMKLEA